MSVRLIDAQPIVKFIMDGLNNPDKMKALGHDAIEILTEIEYAPTVDAVEVEKYEALVEMYHDLREKFVDYVCSGVPNPAPYCLNKCEGCVDRHGWCKNDSDKCQGFNPAEVILDEERKPKSGTKCTPVDEIDFDYAAEDDNGKS